MSKILVKKNVVEREKMFSIKEGIKRNWNHIYKGMWGYSAYHFQDIEYDFIEWSVFDWIGSSYKIEMWDRRANKFWSVPNTQTILLPKETKHLRVCPII